MILKYYAITEKNIGNIKGFMRCMPVGKGKIKIIFVHKDYRCMRRFCIQNNKNIKHR